MLLEGDTVIAADFGIRPVFEPDLLVTVKDDGINTATTPGDAARHLDRIYPFIELADLALEKGEPPSVAIITAINVGARFGIRGRPVAGEATPEIGRAAGRGEVCQYV